jgi:hypothetical protein
MWRLLPISNLPVVAIRLTHFVVGCHHNFESTCDGQPQPCCQCNSTYALWRWRSQKHMLRTITDVRWPCLHSFDFHFESTSRRLQLLCISTYILQRWEEFTPAQYVTGSCVREKWPRRGICCSKPCCYCNSTYILSRWEHMWQAVGSVRRPRHNYFANATVLTAFWCYGSHWQILRVFVDMRRPCRHRAYFQFWIILLVLTH